MEPVKRKAGRPPANKPPEQLGPSLKLTVETDRLLTISARKLKLSKREYADAAVAFFVESGLNPTVERPQGLASVSLKVGEGVANVRAHNADIGNRLFALTRSFERTVYQLMQQQQLSLNMYLEAIEANILKHQVSVETNLLAPMLEQVIKAGVEGYLGRAVGVWGMLKALERPKSDFNEQVEALIASRDKMLTAEMREFMQAHPSMLPRLTPRPLVTQVPAPPPKPAVPGTPSVPAPAKS